MRRPHSLVNRLTLAAVPLVALVVGAVVAAWALWSPLGGSSAAEAAGSHITVNKECSLSDGVFTFKFTITNDGDTFLYRWKVDDTTLGTITWDFPETLAVGQTETVTLTKVRLPGDGLCNWVEASYRTAGWEEVAKARASCCIGTPTPPPPGSVTLTKFKEVGPFTKPIEVCFRLDVKTNGYVPSPDALPAAEQCETPDASGNASFTWTNLPPGEYQIVETLERCEVNGVEQIPCEAYALLAPIGFTMPDPPTAITIPAELTRNTLQPSEICFEKRNPDGSLWSGGQGDVEFTVDSLTDPAFPEQTHFVPTEGNPVCKLVPEGTYEICETPPPSHTVSPSVCQTVDALAGQPATVTVTFVNTPSDGEGCTPGYWRNHFEDWPPTGLSPGDDFDTIFGVDYFDPDITLGDAVWLGGGGVKKIARHGTAALLNALHPSVNYPFTAAEVIAAVQAGDVDSLVKANELLAPGFCD